MIIEKYIVHDMAEAFERGKASLGEDAVLLTQKLVRQKGLLGYLRPKRLEVTMAAENRPVIHPSAAAPRKVSLSAKVFEDRAAETETLLMKELEMLESFRRYSKIHRLDAVEDIRLKQLLIHHFIQEIVESVECAQFMDEACVAFIGSTGVGKTTTIAKIAADAKLNLSKRVGLITMDTYRIGAVEQLKKYADIMDMPMLTVMSAAEMKTAYLKLVKTCDLVLVDTLGTSYRNRHQIEDIRRYLNEIEGLRHVAVLPATLEMEIYEKTLESYRDLGIDYTILTKLDEMDSPSRLFSYIRRLKEPLAMVTTGQNVPDDLMYATTEALMNYLKAGEAVR